MNTFTLKKFREDLRDATLTPGSNRHAIAKKAGVDWASIERFLTNERKALSGKTIEKLWPFVYGEQKSNPSPEEKEQ